MEKVLSIDGNHKKHGTKHNNKDEAIWAEHNDKEGDILYLYPTWLDSDETP